MADSPKAPEPEITPEMIEAGVNILMQFDWGWSEPDTYAANIFRTMMLAAHQDRK